MKKGRKLAITITTLIIFAISLVLHTSLHAESGIVIEIDATVERFINPKNLVIDELSAGDKLKVELVFHTIEAGSGQAGNAGGSTTATNYTDIVKSLSISQPFEAAFEGGKLTIDVDRFAMRTDYGDCTRVYGTDRACSRMGTIKAGSEGREIEMLGTQYSIQQMGEVSNPGDLSTSVDDFINNLPNVKTTILWSFTDVALDPEQMFLDLANASGKSDSGDGEYSKFRRQITESQSLKLVAIIDSARRK